MKHPICLLSASLLMMPACSKRPVIAAIHAEPQSADWAESWWRPRHKEKLAEIRAQKERVELLFIGDSITHDWEGAGQKIWQRRYAPHHAVNLGFSGDRTENVLWRLQNGEVEGIAPKLAIVMIGTNNAGFRQDKPEHIALGIRAILDELEKRLPTTKILLMAIFPRGFEPSDPLRQINEATNRILSRHADDTRVFFSNINPAFLASDGRLPKSLFPDGLHPNAQGYEIWANSIAPDLDRWLSTVTP